MAAVGPSAAMRDAATTNGTAQKSAKKLSLASSSNASSSKKSSLSTFGSEHELNPVGSGVRGQNGAAAAVGGVAPVAPIYTRAGESLRANVPGDVQCSMFCGGRKCKYESSTYWKPDQMALPGIFSHWVTEEILAMARPNTALLNSGGLLKEFVQRGIRSVINLQTPGEHASCGPPLDKSGFSYDPNDLMKADIFFYNFAWKDYGDSSMNSLLDMVKVSGRENCDIDCLAVMQPSSLEAPAFVYKW